MYTQLEPCLYNHISTATTTVVKTREGVLRSIIVNTTAAGAITIYDNTSAAGQVIAVLKASVAEQQFDFNCVLKTGLTIVTAAASDITVTYF